MRGRKKKRWIRPIRFSAALYKHNNPGNFSDGLKAKPK
jgi:hypothetical protein